MTFTDIATAVLAVLAALVLLAMAVVPFVLDHDAERADADADVVDLGVHRAARTHRLAA